jgi:uncharacterized SAM-binding protein YcdF (DUF218 family)
LILITLLMLFFAAIALCRHARVPLALVTVALSWLFAAGWLGAPLLDWAQSSRQPSSPASFTPHTVIVMLGGGTEHDDAGRLVPKRDVYWRIDTSAQLYGQCKRVAQSCEVIVSGGNPQHHEMSEADNYLPFLLQRQLPRADIILENQSRTTYENAKFVSAILRQKSYDSLILVTSAYQMPRALLDFQRFGLSPTPVISNTRRVRLGLLPHFQNLVDAELALHELIGLAQFHIYRALGWF